MTEIIDLIINGITQSWQLLENFQILGTNLLTILITIFIINLILPIILTLAKNKSKGDKK